MNLLDRISSGLAMLSVLIFFSCQDDETATIALEIENSTDVKTERFDFPATTIYIDSLRTDNEPNIAVGKFTDLDLGSISAQSYHRINYQDGEALTDSSRFDSLILQMHIPGRFRSASVDGEVYLKLLEDELYNSVVYLADKQLKFAEVQLDSVPLSSFMSSDSIVRVSLPVYGFRLFNLAKNVTNLNSFSEEFGMTASENSNGMFTVDVTNDSTRFILYSSRSDSIVDETVFTLDNKHFTNLERDFDGYPLEGISTGDTVETVNVNTISPLFGLYVVVNTSQLNSFVMSAENLMINQSDISVDAGDNFSDNAAEFQLYYYKDNSGISGEGLLGSFQNFDSWINTAVLENEAYFPPTPRSNTARATLVEGEYQADITIFTDVLVNTFKNDGELLTNGLVLTPIRFISAENSTIGNNTSLRTYYTIIRN